MILFARLKVLFSQGNVKPPELHGRDEIITANVISAYLFSM